MNIGSDLLHWKSLWILREMSSLEREIYEMVMIMEKMVVNLF